MKIYKKGVILEKPKKMLGTSTIFPITSRGRIQVDNCLFEEETYQVEQIILVVRVKEKKFKP